MGDYRKQYGPGFHHDLSRNAGHEQVFIISEQSPQTSVAASDKGIRLKTYTNLAHGAHGTLFFEWRGPLGGGEQGYKSVLQLDGSFGPAEDQYRKMKKEFARIIPQLQGATTHADLALLYSYDNEWVQGWWGRGPIGYGKVAGRYYQGMKILKRNIDVIPNSADFHQYKLIVAPGLEIVDETQSDGLHTFVRQGGILMINRDAGTKDRFNRYREQKVPGLFADLAGIEVPWVNDGLKRNSKYQYRIALGGQSFRPRSFMKPITLKGAQPLAHFKGGLMEGRPAVTIHKTGKGHVIYVGTDSNDIGFYEQIFLLLAKKFDFSPLMPVPRQVEVVSRETDEEAFVFLLNQADQPAQVSLHQPIKELITDKTLKRKMVIPPLDVRIGVKAQ